MPDTSAPFTPLIETTRGALRENLHCGAVAVVDHQGRLLASVGDAQTTVFSRSTLKPFQALPLLRAGGIARLGLDGRTLALLCASHSGEDVHVQGVSSLLQRLGQDERALRCGCHVPLRFTFFDRAAPEGAQFSALHNNCSGKHSGFVAACVLMGWPLDDYNAPEHPLQQAIRAAVAQLCGLSSDALGIGIDGCSAPNFALPLQRLAYAYARLARGVHDPEWGTELGPLCDAMVQHPELVSGSGRNDLAFTQAGRGDWVSKVGADGVQCLASRSRGQALAIKVQDGARTPLYAATVEVLDQLGWLDDAQREALQSWRMTPIRNARGLVVGERRPVFALERPPAQKQDRHAPQDTAP